jgi:hypothetical protein
MLTVLEGKHIVNDARLILLEDILQRGRLAQGDLVVRQRIVLAAAVQKGLEQRGLWVVDRDRNAGNER